MDKIVIIYGMPASGKTTISIVLAEEFLRMGTNVKLITGDNFANISYSCNYLESEMDLKYENMKSVLNNLISYVHYDNQIATIGRTCPRLRIIKSKAKGCTIDCDQAIQLEFFEPYGLSKLDFEKANIYPLMYNINNVIYHRGNVYDKFDYQRSDGVIFDYRLNGAQEINQGRITFAN